MKLKFYIVNAFARKPFEGNPAAICLLKEWLPKKVMQSIAAQNNISETAFFVLEKNLRSIKLRWFSPTTEVGFCGHATMAAAHIFFTKINPIQKTITFLTRRGKLVVKKNNNDYEMFLPKEENKKRKIDSQLTKAMGLAPQKTYQGANILAVYKTQKEIESLEPNLELLKKFCAPINVGIIATAIAASSNIDFVSRFFAPAHGIAEDPVTGSAHCQSAPYWSERLNKTKLIAKQISKRGGTLNCRVCDDKIIISGNCVDYAEGVIGL